MAFAAVAAHAAGHQVARDGGAAVRLWDDVIDGWAAAELFAAIGALIVPGQKDLITGRSPRNQAGFVNPVAIHRDLAEWAPRSPRYR